MRFVSRTHDIQALVLCGTRFGKYGRRFVLWAPSSLGNSAVNRGMRVAANVYWYIVSFGTTALHEDISKSQQRP